MLESVIQFRVAQARRPLIRINPRAPQLGGVRGIGQAMGAQVAVPAISARLIS